MYDGNYPSRLAMNPSLAPSPTANILVYKRCDGVSNTNTLPTVDDLQPPLPRRLRPGPASHCKETQTPSPSNISSSLILEVEIVATSSARTTVATMAIPSTGGALPPLVGSVEIEREPRPRQSRRTCSSSVPPLCPILACIQSISQHQVKALCLSVWNRAQSCMKMPPSVWPSPESYLGPILTQIAAQETLSVDFLVTKLTELDTNLVRLLSHRTGPSDPLVFFGPHVADLIPSGTRDPCWPNQDGKSCATITVTLVFSTILPNIPSDLQNILALPRGWDACSSGWALARTTRGRDLH